MAVVSGAAAQARSDDVAIVRPPLASVVLDRDGGLLGEIGPQARTWVRMVDLPAWVGQAFVAIEDRRFYQHDGVDVLGVVGALRDNLLRGFSGRPRGGSTITQQLVGSMGLVNRRDITLGRKMREAELARALERRHTKAEILEAYLNYINFGHGWYGVEAAARHYFAKEAAELSLAEAALLAALPNSPVLYDPRANPGAARRRRNLVLRRMAEQRFITEAVMRAAARQPLLVAPDDGFSVRAPYVVEWVRQWLVDRYGLTAVNTGGFNVTTTVDARLQAAANEAIEAGLARVESMPGWRWPRYRGGAGRAQASRTPYLQGLLVATDPHTGDVLALVGGRDFRDSEFNRAVQGLRQAGSAFKPFVYATALGQGLPPTQLLDDAPLSLSAGGGQRYTPGNSDGVFRGPVTMRTALAQSINVPAIRLALRVGLDSVIGTARRLGLSTEIPPYAPTAIGAADVRPLELVAAYGAFATLGAYAAPRFIAQVKDQAGLPIYEAAQAAPQQALDPRVAFQLVSILEEAVERGTGTVARRALPAEVPLAGKTGTTNDNTDVWFIGFTPDLVAGVWLGFDRPQPIARGAFGGTLAAPVWGLFASAAYRILPVPASWQVPAGLVAARVRRHDGVPVQGDSTDASYTEYFLEGTEPTVRGITQRVLGRLRLWTRVP